ALLWPNTQAVVEQNAIARKSVTLMIIRGRILDLISSKVGFEMVLHGNDREVIEGCRRGDSEAFRALFEAHKDKVYSIALRFSGNHAAEMDIAQDTFLKLLSSVQDFRGDSSFDSWLYRLVVNRCLDQQRSGRRWMPFLEGWFDAVRSPKESVLHELL